MEATIDQKSNKSLSQCLIEAYNLTQHKDLIQYIAKYSGTIIIVKLQ